MKLPQTLRRALALLCCAAMLLPCLPAALAAGDGTAEFDFEGYTSQGELEAVWTQTGNTTATKPTLSTARVAGGRQSLLLEDTENNKSSQARTRIENSVQPKGTELIMTVDYYVESTSGSGVPYIRLYTSSGHTDASTYSVGRWDRLSAIHTTGNKNETVFAYMISNTATLSKVYYDNISVKVLDEGLALEYIDEKIAIPGNPGLVTGLLSNALSLADVDEGLVPVYARLMNKARQEKGRVLTRDEVQDCINRGNTGDNNGFDDSFESYAEGPLTTGVWRSTGNSPNDPTVTTAYKHSGSKSVMFRDEDSKTGITFVCDRTNIVNLTPAGTEFIATVWFKVPEAGVFTMRIDGASKDTDVSTYLSTDEWSPMSGIYTMTSDREAVRLMLISNAANQGVGYFDDVSFQVLTDELALDYVEERLQAGDAPGLLVGLQTKALGLASVDGEVATQYLAQLKADRQAAGAKLDRARIQAGVDAANAAALAETLSGGTVKVGYLGDISAAVTQLPQGVSAQWVSVSPTGKNVALSGGKASAKAIPATGTESYSATLRLSGGGKNFDIPYTIQLVDGGAYDREILAKVADGLCGDSVISVTATGSIPVPAFSGEGVSAKWGQIKRDPGKNLSLSGGRLSVTSVPKGWDVAETVVSLTLTKGNASQSIDYTVVVYDPTFHVLVKLPNASLEQLDDIQFPVGWEGGGMDTESVYIRSVTSEARTGLRSMHVVDKGDMVSHGIRTKRDLVPAKVGYDYVATVWIKGTASSTTADRNGAAIYLEFNRDGVNRDKAYSSPGLPIRADQWTQLTMRGKATAAYVDVMGYSYQATISDMYVDDAMLWEITPAGILDEIDTLVRAGKDADTLYERLGSGTLSVSGLSANNKQNYLSGLAAKRSAKGSALTAAELASAVTEINAGAAADNKATLTALAKTVKTSQQITQTGVIPLPKLSDSSVSVKWTKVEGSARIRIVGSGAVADSLPGYGQGDESATMTLTLSKGGTSITVSVNTTLKAYTKTLTDMVNAAQAFRVESLLAGQKANAVKSNITKLPATLDGGIAVKWRVVDSATGSVSGALNAAGTVTRPAYGQSDAAVVLRGTLTKGGESYVHDWYVLIPALSADEARAVVTKNVDFEAEAPGQDTDNVTGWNKLLKWKDGKNEILTDYAVVDGRPYTGGQSLRIRADGAVAGVRNELTFTAQEGFAYSLQVMAYAEGDTVAPKVKLSFWDNEGSTLTTHTVNYATQPGGDSVWKNLSVTAVAPAGAVQACVELDGGTKAGLSWFDDVRLYELPIVANGSFELGKAGWETNGSVSGGKLTLTAGQTALSRMAAADRGVTYFLSLTADGGKAALRFTDKDGKLLARYEKNAADGAFFAYTPAGTAGVQVELTGPMTADHVRILRSVTGTDVTDGSFELSTLGVGTPWDLTGAAVDAQAGKSGAGLRVNAGGSAVSTIIPIIDGKKYTFVADVKGAQGTLEVGLYTGGATSGLQRTVSVKSAGDDWNTVSYTFDPVPEAVGNATIEHAYAQITLKGAASFDNVRAMGYSATASNYSMENVNNTKYGTFPFNWSSYGKAAAWSANQTGQFTENVKGLGVELFGLGEGGIRSSLVSGATGGKAYEVSVKAKGSGAKLSVEFWDGSYNKLSSVGVDINSTEFKTYTAVGTAPKGAVYASLSVGGTGKGLVYVDEAVIAPVVRSIGENVQLFLDDWLIDETTNVKRTLHEGEKTGKMINGGWYPNLFFDEQEQVYKMWYQISGYYLQYTTSKDGVNWSAPIACRDADGSMSKSGSVFKDVNEPDPNKRYKRIAFNHEQSLVTGSYDYYTSPDGINWTFAMKGRRGQDVATVAYDPVNKEYVSTYKISEPSKNTKRTHSVSVSKDLRYWTEGVRMYTVGVQQEAGDEYLRLDGYGTGMYPLGDSYVAANWRFMMDDDDGFGGLMDSVLMFSRNLDEDWVRLLDENGEQVVAVPRGANGSWDDAQIYTADAPINIGNETWWYYAGWTGDHGTVGVPKAAAIGAAKWRLNGFGSMDFGTNGVLTTELFTLAGNKVHINAKGSLKVELLDQSGAVVATAVFSGDSVDSVLTFDKDISGQVGKAVRLRFSGSNAQLYTIQLEGTMFSDVATGTWYHRAAHYAVANGIMSGYGGGKFGPNDTLSRAMVVQMLFNKEGQNPVGGSHGFDDVPADQWFNNAVTWGTRKGVMSGYGGGKFGPNDAVTIEQIAVILWNYSGNPAFKASADGLGEHSGWAANALGWAIERGLLVNMPYNKVTDQATRAQAAQMFTNFLR
ncbi:MAG: S-layer homology domain-containing protein [Oscillospiraceae bacterium]|nr:S-layer homology domain-containing protein [Oscillospiraceae bacterium]